MFSCEECGQDLDTPRSVVDHYIRLSNQQYPTRGAIMDMYIVPPIPKDLLFCRLKCCQRWISRNGGYAE